MCTEAALTACLDFCNVAVLHQQLDEDNMLSEEQNDEEDAEIAMETAVVEMDMIIQKPDDSVAVRQEEFPELDRGNKGTLEKLKDKKVLFLMTVRTKIKLSPLTPGC